MKSKRLGRVLRAVREDPYDVIIGVGLVLLWFGLSRIYPPVAPVVVGLFLVGFGVVGARNMKREDK